MKQKISILLVLVMLCSLLFAVPAYAVGEGNLDGGGGGMGQGTSQNFWNSGNEGVRVTVIRVSDHAPVTRPIDLTNKSPAVRSHFGKVSKMSYTNGFALTPSGDAYEYVNPAQALPKIISSNGSNNIAAIKSYFTDEQVIRSIASITGMQFDVLVGGEYRLLIEPIAYYTFQGVMIATTATEAAMYDEVLSGGLRRKMVSLTHKNLPLAMFLETEDLGYAAWGGSKSSAASNADIKASLGLGIVRFNEMPPEAPELDTFDYEYRTNTEVITAVDVSGGQSDPDNPVSVVFNIGGRSYTVSNVYYPNGDSQLAWVRWTTPAEPQTMTITVRVRGAARFPMEQSMSTLWIWMKTRRQTPMRMTATTVSHFRPCQTMRRSPRQAGVSGVHGGMPTGCGIQTAMAVAGGVITDGGSLILTVTPQAFPRPCASLPMKRLRQPAAGR